MTMQALWESISRTTFPVKGSTESEAFSSIEQEAGCTLDGVPVYHKAKTHRPTNTYLRASSGFPVNPTDITLGLRKPMQTEGAHAKSTQEASSKKVTRKIYLKNSA